MNKNTQILAGFIGIAANVIILLYVLELEKENCTCSENWKRDYIKYWSIIVIISAVIGLFIPSLLDPKKIMKNSLYKLYFSISLLAGLFYTISLIVYYVQLNNKKNCICSNDWKKHFMIYPIAMIALTFIFVFVLGSAIYVIKGPK
jgi:hypothetical protein